MGGIYNITNVTFSGLESMANSTDLPTFLVKINQIVYAGWLWFILLLILWVILFVSANKLNNKPMSNAMYASAICTVLGFVLRAIHVTINGGVYSLITDHQLWVFPIFTIVLVVIIWSTKD